MGENFNIINKTKSTLPHVPFLKIKDFALGKNYSLSLVFVGKKLSRELNYTYRKKDKPANILSFSLDKNVGEIFICPKIFTFTEKETSFLFIHGLLHLKGYRHGSRMEDAEIKLQKQFNL